MWVEPGCGPGRHSWYSYGLKVLRIESQWGRDFLHLSRPTLGPNQPPIKWVLFLFSGDKAVGPRGWPSTPSSAEVKERVELYLYSASGTSWPVLVWTLPLLYLYGATSCGFWYWQGQALFDSPWQSGPVLWSAEPHIQWVKESSSWGHETVCSPPFSAKATNEWNSTPVLSYAIIVWTWTTLPFYVYGVHICKYTCSQFLTVLFPIADAVENILGCDI